ncbi:MAG: FkbM family methyltransferase [Bacteroidota bacterium]
MQPKDNTPAPIVLFVYNRPEHTRQTLEALTKNKLAKESILYVYADGPKPNTDVETQENIAKTREVVRQKQWCKEVHTKEAEDNKGLANSITEGVTEVVNKYGKVIVLEDDIVTSPGFLQYMNDALNIYESHEEVMHVSGYMFPVNISLPSTFFYNTASCWGWGTWQRSWKHFNPNARFLARKIKEQNLIESFNIEGTYPYFYKVLVDNAEGKQKTWAVKWYASFFLQGGHALHPYPSLVNNIGNDGSGINSPNTNRFGWEILATSIEVNLIPITESKKARRAIREYYRKHYHKKSNLRARLLAVAPHRVKHIIKKNTDANYKRQFKERQRLRHLPRYEATTTTFLGKEITIPDAASFLFMKKEIFEQEIYKFHSSNNFPLILDCGANIGLSIIYFKKLFPNARVIGFEPDEKIFDILENNLNAFELSNITLEKKAVWKEETILKFVSEGADAGRLVEGQPNEVQKEVETARLKDYLQEPIDFLKIDIEGAEMEVIMDCKDQLHHADRIFIEYHSFVNKAQSLDKILEILKNSGFRYHIQSPGLQSKQPFIKINEMLGMDMQLNIYGFKPN